MSANSIFYTIERERHTHFFLSRGRDVSHFIIASQVLRPEQFGPNALKAYTL